MELKNVRLSIPEGCNIIVGQSHFIKTAEDLYEIVTSGCPHSKFGVAFCEASGPCLIRVEGNDADLKKTAAENAMSLGAGHTFVVLLKDAFPDQRPERHQGLLGSLPIYCATANPLEVVVAETEQGRGVLGVVDGFSPQGGRDRGGCQSPPGVSAGRSGTSGEKLRNRAVSSADPALRGEIFLASSARDGVSKPTGRNRWLQANASLPRPTALDM